MNLFRLRNQPARPSYRDIDPGELIEYKGARLVNVREPNELVGPLGYIHGVDNVPLGTVAAAATDWNRAQTVVVICRSGGRSARAAQELVRLGFSDVVNLRGGMLGWNQAGLPNTHLKD